MPHFVPLNSPLCSAEPPSWRKILRSMRRSTIEESQILQSLIGFSATSSLNSWQCTPRTEPRRMFATRISVVFTRSAPAPLVAPRNDAPRDTVHSLRNALRGCAVCVSWHSVASCSAARRRRRGRVRFVRSGIAFSGTRRRKQSRSFKTKRKNMNTTENLIASTCNPPQPAASIVKPAKFPSQPQEWNIVSLSVKCSDWPSLPAHPLLFSSTIIRAAIRVRPHPTSKLLAMSSEVVN